MAELVTSLESLVSGARAVIWGHIIVLWGKCILLKVAEHVIFEFLKDHGQNIIRTLSVLGMQGTGGIINTYFSRLVTRDQRLLFF
jgi:hypothetical protein